MRSIRVTFEGGKVKAEAEGFVGQECEEYINIIKSAIGEATHVERKPEFYQDAEQEQQLWQ